MSEMTDQLRKLINEYKPQKTQVMVWDIPDATKPNGYDRGMMDIVAGNEHVLLAILEKAHNNGGKAYRLAKPEPAPLRFEPIYEPPKLEVSRNMSMYHSFRDRPVPTSFVMPTMYEPGSGGATFTKVIDLPALIASKRIEAYKVIAAYAQTITGSNHRRFRVERKLKRWWDKQVKAIAR